MRKTTYQKAQQFKALYKRENQIPLLGFFIGSEYPIERYPSMKKLPSGKKLSPQDFDIEGFVSDALRLYELHEKYGGDFIFSESAYWGIPWLEALIGLDIYADQNSGSIYAAVPKDFSINEIQDFNRENSWAVLCRDMLEALAKAANGRFPLAATRMRGIADLLAAVYSQEQLIYEMLDNGEQVKETAKQLTNIFIDFGRFQLEYIPEFLGGMGSFYYYMWVPYGTVWHQEDAAALLSPELYSEFIMPFDSSIAEAFNGCIIHQHPTGYMMYEKLIDMKFLALELHIDTGGKSAKELNPVHTKILQKKPLCIWGALSDEDLQVIFGSLTHQGLAVICMLPENEAHRAQEIYEKYIG